MRGDILYYAVYQENTLGFLFEGLGDKRHLGILHASVLKGSTYNWQSGPLDVNMNEVRKATAQDFEAYRVALPCDYYELNVNH